MKGLKKARRLFNSQKFKEVIRLLEPEIFQYRESFAFFYLLGVSCLYSGEIGGAFSYLKRALQLKEHNVNTLLSLAVVYLKKTDKENAIRTWLKVLEINPDNKIAQKGLNMVRKSLEPEDIIALCESRRIYSLFPQIRKNILSKVLFFITILCIISVVSVSLYIYLPRLMKKNIRPGIENYELPKRQGLLEYSGTTMYTFTEKEIETIFNKVKSLFHDYKDNLALVEINRLLHSNASMDVKSIMYAIRDHLQAPDFSTLKKEDSFTYIEVTDEPYLYENCYIRWEGRVGGLQISEHVITFDLWVGNTEEFFGVVPVILFFGENLANGMTIEVLGEVKRDDEKIVIEGAGIHRIEQE